MPFAIGIEHTKTEHNVGTLLRSALNFGASMVFTVGRRYTRQSSDTLHTARHLPVLHFLTWADAWAAWPADWVPVAVEIREEAGAWPSSRTRRTRSTSSARRTGA